jgi:hypothetical protein
LSNPYCPKRSANSLARPSEPGSTAIDTNIPIEYAERENL